MGIKKFGVEPSEMEVLETSHESEDSGDNQEVPEEKEQ